MKAVVYEDTRRVGVHKVEEAAIEDPTDVVVRVTSSAICGTDLRMFDGVRTTSCRPELLPARPGASRRHAPFVGCGTNRAPLGFIARGWCGSWRSFRQGDGLLRSSFAIS